MGFFTFCISTFWNLMLLALPEPPWARLFQVKTLINLNKLRKRVDAHLPCLDSDTICGSRKLCSINNNVRHISFWIFRTQASNTDQYLTFKKHHHKWFLSFLCEPVFSVISLKNKKGARCKWCNLIPWPGPQVISVSWTLCDPLTIEMQSSPWSSN